MTSGKKRRPRREKGPIWESRQTETIRNRDIPAEAKPRRSFRSAAVARFLWGEISIASGGNRSRFVEVITFLSAASLNGHGGGWATPAARARAAIGAGAHPIRLPRGHIADHHPRRGDNSWSARGRPGSRSRHGCHYRRGNFTEWMQPTRHMSRVTRHFLQENFGFSRTSSGRRRIQFLKASCVPPHGSDEIPVPGPFPPPGNLVPPGAVSLIKKVTCDV